MSALTLEERVELLEAEVKQLKHPAKQTGELDSSDETVPWWEQIRGQFKNDPDYDEAMRLGREYRESLRPKDDEDI